MPTTIEANYYQQILRICAPFVRGDAEASASLARFRPGRDVHVATKDDWEDYWFGLANLWAGSGILPMFILGISAWALRGVSIRLGDVLMLSGFGMLCFCLAAGSVLGLRGMRGIPQRDTVISIPVRAWTSIQAGCAACGVAFVMAVW